MGAVAVTDTVNDRSLAIDDEALAARCSATTVLITADCSAAVERVARRIHAASGRAASPFVRVAAATLPIDAATLTETWADVLDTVGDGTLLLTDVEQLPAIVQQRLFETAESLHAACEPTCRGRLIAGTSAVLRERIADGTFCERLFYRLNTIHVDATSAIGDQPEPVAL